MASAVPKKKKPDLKIVIKVNCFDFGNQIYKRDPDAVVHNSTLDVNVSADELWR